MTSSEYRPPNQGAMRMKSGRQSSSRSIDLSRMYLLGPQCPVGLGGRRIGQAPTTCTRRRSCARTSRFRPILAHRHSAIYEVGDGEQAAGSSRERHRFTNETKAGDDARTEAMTHKPFVRSALPPQQRRSVCVVSAKALSWMAAPSCRRRVVRPLRPGV